MAEIRTGGEVLEAVWLSTCNRVELYAVLADTPGTVEEPVEERVKAALAARLKTGEFMCPVLSGWIGCCAGFWGAPG